MQRFQALLIFLKHIRKSACHNETLIHEYNRYLPFKLILKVHILKNQNNFLNKSNFFIPQIKNYLATPATSDPDLKSFIHSSHKNSKTLELFDKSSVVDFTIYKILTELGNVSEIHNGSILLLPPITTKIFLSITS